MRAFAEEGLVGVLTDSLAGARQEKPKPQNQEKPAQNQEKPAQKKRGERGRFAPREPA